MNEHESCQERQRTIRLRWQNLHTKHQAAVAENARLRAALDELNDDVEELLSVAGQQGVEAAKSHHIRSQAALIRKWRPIVKQAREGERNETNSC